MRFRAIVPIIRLPICFFVSVLVVTAGLRAQEEEKTTEEKAEDLVIMKKGGRLRGKILTEYQEKITIRTRDPRSTFDVPLDDIYSINGFNVSKLQAMKAHLHDTVRRISLITDEGFSSSPALKISQNGERNDSSSHPLAADLFGAADVQMSFLNMLNLPSKTDFQAEKLKKVLRPSITLHEERPNLVIHFQKNKGGGRPFDGSLTFEERFRIAHLAAHLWLRQNFSEEMGKNTSRVKDQIDAPLTRFSVLEGAANYLAVASFLKTHGQTIDRPASIRSFLIPHVHVSGEAERRMPRLFKQRMSWVTFTGTRFVWMLIQAGGWEGFEKMLTADIKNSSIIDQQAIAYLSGGANESVLFPSEKQAKLQSRWKRKGQGRLGIPFVRWLSEQMETEGNSSFPWLRGYSTDYIQFYRPGSGEGQLMTWVSIWESGKQAQRFYEHARTYLETLPWSLRQGPGGDTHRYYSRRNLRISIHKKGDRVLFMISPEEADSDRSALKEQFTASEPSVRSLSSPVEASQAKIKQVAKRWKKSQHPWTDLSQSSGEEGVSIVKKARQIVIKNPHLRLSPPSFWTVDVGPFPEDHQLLVMHPRGSRNVEISVNIRVLDDQISDQLISLLRKREIELEQYHRNVREVSPSSIFPGETERKDLKILTALSFVIDKPVGPNRHVHEVLIRRKNQLISYQLWSPEEPDSLLKRRFASAIRSSAGK